MELGKKQVKKARGLKTRESKAGAVYVADVIIYLPNPEDCGKSESI